MKKDFPMDYRRKLDEDFVPKLRRIYDCDNNDIESNGLDEKNKTKEKNEDISFEKPTNTDDVDYNEEFQP